MKGIAIRTYTGQTRKFMMSVYLNGKGICFLSSFQNRQPRLIEASLGTINPSSINMMFTQLPRLQTCTETSFSSASTIMSPQIFHSIYPIQQGNVITTHRQMSPPPFYPSPPLQSSPQPVPCGNLLPTFHQFTPSPPPPRSKVMVKEFDDPVIITKLQPNAPNDQAAKTLATYYPNKLFVGSLSRSTTPSDLATFFGRYGMVTEAKIIPDSNGHSKGYGFVTFQSNETVRSILKNGPLFINNKRIAIASAIRKKHFDD